MEPRKVNNEEKLNGENDSKVGTWFSLGIVGLGILLTYFVLFGFYMDRV